MGAAWAQKGHSKSVNSTRLTGALAWSLGWCVPDVDGLGRAGGDEFLLDALALRHAREQTFDARTERCVALPADQAGGR
jgi:hypothetical protein